MTQTPTDRDILRTSTGTRSDPFGQISPFVAGMLLAGAVVGPPMTVIGGLFVGHDLRAVAVPLLAAAVVLTLWRREQHGRPGRTAGTLRALRSMARGQALQVAAGATVVALFLPTVGGTW